MSTPAVSPRRATYFSSRRMAGPVKVGKTLAPDIRPRLRRGSLTPSLLQEPAARGHPWPIASLAASMPLNPLRNDSVRPPEGGSWSCLMVARRAGAIIREVQEKLSDSSEPKSPSGGRVEMSRRGASRRDAARGITGQGWPVYAGPRSGIGRREPRRRRGRMSGGAFFCLLFFAQTKKSESPGGAKRDVPTCSIIGLKANPSRLTQSCQRGIRAPPFQDAHPAYWCQSTPSRRSPQVLKCGP